MGLRSSVVNHSGRAQESAPTTIFTLAIAKLRNRVHVAGAIVILSRTAASVHSAFSRSTQTDFAELPHPAGSTLEQETTDMANGTVKWFNTQKGFGFIAPESGGKDVFVHISSLERAGMTGLADDQKVTYDIEAGRDGRESAINLALA
jgi:CspA family cold shock protein